MRVELVCLGGTVVVRELAFSETGFRRLPRLRCTVAHDRTGAAPGLDVQLRRQVADELREQFVSENLNY